MSILSDSEIKVLSFCAPPMIKPFVNYSVRNLATETSSRKVISYGLSSFGYDVRLAEDVKFFTNVNSSIVDPKNFDDSCLVDAKVMTDVDGAKYVLLPPNSYMLGHTIETFDIPRDIMVVCVGKSTYARAGILVNVTPIEAGFKGTVVIEIGNGTNVPSKVYLGEGVAQFMFFKGVKPCEVSYADRGGKYQLQTGLTLPKA